VSVMSESALLTQFKIGWKVVRASVKTVKFSGLPTDRPSESLAATAAGCSGSRQACLIESLNIFDGDRNFAGKSGVSTLVLNLCGQFRSLVNRLRKPCPVGIFELSNARIPRRSSLNDEIINACVVFVKSSHPVIRLLKRSTQFRTPDRRFDGIKEMADDFVNRLPKRGGNIATGNDSGSGTVSRSGSDLPSPSSRSRSVQAPISQLHGGRKFSMQSPAGSAGAVEDAG